MKIKPEINGIGLLSALVFLTPSGVHAAATPSPAASPPAHQTRRISTPEDHAAIQQVLTDFMAAIRQKDGRKLSTLILNSNIMFTSPGDQTRVDSARAFDSNFDGISNGSFLSFARYISTTPETIEERFYNVEINQDGPLAWVLFDYEFYADGKVSNYGMEHWQLRKTDGRWKIFSVVWTQYDPMASQAPVPAPVRTPVPASAPVSAPGPAPAPIKHGDR